MAVEIINHKGRDVYAEPMSHGEGYRIIGPVDAPPTIEEKLDQALAEIEVLKTNVDGVKTEVGKIPKQAQL